MFSFEPFFFFVSMIWLAGVAKQMNKCKMTIEYFGSPKYVSFIRLFRLCQVFCCGDDLIFFFYYFPCTEFDSLKTGNTSDKWGRTNHTEFDVAAGNSIHRFMTQMKESKIENPFVQVQVSTFMHDRRQRAPIKCVLCLVLAGHLAQILAKCTYSTKSTEQTICWC